MIGSFFSTDRTMFPCIDCKNRKVGCHGHCMAYKEAAAANQELNKAIRASATWRKPEPVTIMRSQLSKKCTKRRVLQDWRKSKKREEL